MGLKEILLFVYSRYGNDLSKKNKIVKLKKLLLPCSKSI